MSEITSILKGFIPLPNWEDYINDNFGRNAGLYSSASIKELYVNIDGIRYNFPHRIIFNNEYIKSKRNIRKIETTVIDNRKVKVIERTRHIPFRFYQRDNRRYSGSILDIIKDILCDKPFSVCLYNNNLAQVGNSPLYNIDSNIEWPSYIFYFGVNPEYLISDISDTDQATLSILTEITREYGINISYNEAITNSYLVIFPISYIRVAENRIKKDENGQEKLSLILQFNRFNTIFSISRPEIEARILIKDIYNQTIYKQSVPIKYENSQYCFLEIAPAPRHEIGFSSIEIFVNNVLVENRSGHYIRSIKIDMKAE